MSMVITGPSAAIEGLVLQIGDASALVVMAGLTILMTVETLPAVGLLIPADVSVVGTAAAVEPEAAVAGGVGAAGGTILGWTISFGVGRLLGPALRRGPLGRLVAPHRWDAAERLLAGSSARALLILQFLPFNALVPTVAGAVGMRYRRFMGHAAVSAVAWAATYTTIGVVGAGLGPVVMLLPVGVALGGLVVAATVARLRRRADRRRAAYQLVLPTDWCTVAPTPLVATSGASGLR